MSGKLVSEVAAYSRAATGARFVLAMLAHHVHSSDDTRSVQVPAEVLADECGMSRASCFNAIADLVDAGEVRRSQGGGGRGKASVLQVADLVELYGEPRLPRRRRQAPPAGARPLTQTVQNLDGIATQTVQETVHDLDGKPRVLKGWESGEERKDPLTPASGGTEDPRSLDARAERARSGSRRRRDVIALQAVVDEQTRPPEPWEREAWGRAQEQLRAAIPGSAWQMAATVEFVGFVEGDEPVVRKGLQHHRTYLREALLDHMIHVARERRGAA